MRGKFITVEGCEGAGKSRQIKLLADYFTSSGIEHIVTREPGGSLIAEKIRTIILDKQNAGMRDECEALLYAAARVQHLQDTVMPALERGVTVLCDRYIDSSFAYQAYARGLGMQFVKDVNSYALKNCMPDLTLFLNISPDAAFSRKGGADEDDRLEMSGLSFHNRVYGGYLMLLKEYSGRIVSIDCSGEKQQTHANIISALKKAGVL